METKLKEIDQLRAEIKEREDKLRALLYPEKAVTVVLPADFSINDEILNILRAARGLSVSTSTMYEALTKKYPKYKLEKKRILSALAYLKNRKKQIEGAEYGAYRILPDQVTSE